MKYSETLFDLLFELLDICSDDTLLLLGFNERSGNEFLDGLLYWLAATRQQLNKIFLVADCSSDEKYKAWEQDHETALMSSLEAAPLYLVHDNPVSCATTYADDLCGDKLKIIAFDIQGLSEKKALSESIKNTYPEEARKGGSNAMPYWTLISKLKSYAKAVVFSAQTTLERGSFNGTVDAVFESGQVASLIYLPSYSIPFFGTQPLLSLLNYESSRDLSDAYINLVDADSFGLRTHALPGISKDLNLRRSNYRDGRVLASVRCFSKEEINKMTHPSPDGKFCERISLNALRQNEYRVSPGHYLQADYVEKAPTYLLEELLDDCFIGMSVGMKTREETVRKTGKYRLVSISSFSSNRLLPSDDGNYLENITNREARFRLQPNDILLSRMNFNSEVQLVEELYEPAIAGQNLIVLRPKTGAVDPAYLAAFLSSKVGIEAVDRLRSRTANGMGPLSIRELRKLQIPMLCSKDTHWLVDEYTTNIQIIKDAQEKLAKSKQRIYEAFNSLLA